MGKKGEGMGARLKRLRQRAGLSQERLARAAGVPVGSLRQWEYGRRQPNLKGFLALADGLGVTLDELAGREAKARGRGKGK